MAVDVRSTGLRIVAADEETILDLDPLPGLWTTEQDLRLTDHSRRLLEFADGALEVLPPPTDQHQIISRFLLLALYALTQQTGGTVLYAPLRLQIRPERFREPDLLLVRDAQDPRRQNAYWRGADLVIALAREGILALPESLRDRYLLEPGDSLTLLDLGGVFVLSPRGAEIDSIADSLK